MKNYLSFFPQNRLIPKGLDGMELLAIEERIKNKTATKEDYKIYAENIDDSDVLEENAQYDPTLSMDLTPKQSTSEKVRSKFQKTGNNVGNAIFGEGFSSLSKEGKMSKVASSLGVDSSYIGSGEGLMGEGAAMGVGIAATAGVDALKMVDNLAMGDKNFGAQSAAIDSAVHGASSALIKSGNPYAMAAGAALEGANFLTKAGGQTTEGFDVNINTSGYGNIGHKDSSSSRDFGAFIGLGGLNQAKMDRKLAKRNEEALMALKASNVADTTKFEQEARMNSVQDVIQQNEIALSGGVDSSLLAAKKGGKLQQSNGLKVIGHAKGGVLIVEEKPIKPTIIEEPELPCMKAWVEEPPIAGEITKAQNGAKLELIEVSETPSVIPSGALHKNKHHDFDLDNITKKGIPVVTVEDDTVTTLPEIQALQESVVQHAEVEKEEIIFNKDLTDFIEELRAKWHDGDEQDNSILLEAGMRLAKELIENTEDNTNVTQKAQTQI